MRNIIWRNQASAILGVMVILLPFSGFPDWAKTVFFVILGFLIVLFGFTGSRKISGGEINTKALNESEIN